MPKAAHTPTTSPPEPPPLWSVADIGRRLVALGKAHNEADELKIASPDAELEVQHHAQRVMDFTEDRRLALMGVALSMPGQTLADAVTHGVLALEEVLGIEANELEPHQLDTACRSIRRALVSMVTIAAREAAIDPAALEDLNHGWLLACKEAFPDGGLVE